MSQAYKCDCCGGYFDATEVHVELEVRTVEPDPEDPDSRTVTTDYELEHLCTGCSAELLGAMRDKMAVIRGEVEEEARG